jgi:DNA repair protein RecO (recombination protein O)
VSAASVPRTFRSSAVLVRSVDYGEADRIVTLLTEHTGLVALIARSARKSKKRFAGALEPFGVIEAELALGRGDVGRLASARLVRGFPALLSRLSAMREAGKALELVRDATPPRESDPRLLETVIVLFEKLADAAMNEEAVRAAFELRYLALLGLAPHVDACARCGRAPDASQSALFDGAVGAIVCRACGGGPILLPASTRRLMSDATKTAWAEDLDAWTSTDIHAALEALDAFVERHVRASGRGARS